MSALTQHRGVMLGRNIPPVPTFISSVGVANLTTTSGARSLSAGTRAVSDLLLAFIAEGSLNTITGPSGYTALYDQGNPGAPADNFFVNTYKVLKRAATNNSSDNLSWTPSTSTARYYGLLLALRTTLATITVSPPISDPTASFNAVTAPSVGHDIVVSLAIALTGSDVGVSGPPTGFTQLDMSASFAPLAGGGHARIGVWTRPITAAGSQAGGTVPWSPVGGGSMQTLTYQLALTP